MLSGIFGLGAKSVWEDAWLDPCEIKVALLGVGYAQDQDAHDSFTDVTDEITDPNYTAGGYALTGKSVTYDPATNKVACKAATVQLPAILSCNKAVIYDNSHPTKRVLRYVDFEGTIITDKLTWDTEGIIVDTVS